MIQLTVRSDSGREFQTNGPETQNALSPSLERVYKMIFNSVSKKYGVQSCNICFTTVCGVGYFITQGSNVYLATLDATKAFDRINHKMADSGVLVHVITV